MQGTPATQTAGETRLVPPLEHFTGLHLSPFPSWNVEGVWGGWGHTVCHGCARRVRTGVSGLVSFLRVG